MEFWASRIIPTGDIADPVAFFLIIFQPAIVSLLSAALDPSSQDALHPILQDVVAVHAVLESTPLPVPAMAALAEQERLFLPMLRRQMLLPRSKQWMDLNLPRRPTM